MKNSNRSLNPLELILVILAYVYLFFHRELGSLIINACKLQQQGQGGLGQFKLGAIALGRVSPQPNISIFGVPFDTPASSSVTPSITPHHESDGLIPTSPLPPMITSTPKPNPTSNTQSHPYAESTPSASSSSSISSTSQPNQTSNTESQSRTTKTRVDMIVSISFGVALSILAISFGVWYARRTVSRATEKRIAREMVNAPFVMQRSPSDAERHRITEFMIREKRDMQPSNLHRVLPPAKFLDRLHTPAINVRRTVRRAAGHAEVYVRLHEDGGPVLPFPNRTDLSVIDVPPTYSTIGVTHVV